MVDPIVGQAAETKANAGRELGVSIFPDHYVRFEGTAAQLQAEGLIPAGFEWPRAAARKYWEAEGFKYELCRKRPEGHKGPMRSWLDLDNWRVDVSVAGRDYVWQRRRNLERKIEEIHAEIRRYTAVGMEEDEAKMGRAFRALVDKKFQAFKALVPGLVPASRGRKPKAAA